MFVGKISTCTFDELRKHGCSTPRFRGDVEFLCKSPCSSDAASYLTSSVGEGAIMLGRCRRQDLWTPPARLIWNTPCRKSRRTSGRSIDRGGERVSITRHGGSGFKTVWARITVRSSTAANLTTGPGVQRYGPSPGAAPPLPDLTTPGGAARRSRKYFTNFTNLFHQIIIKKYFLYFFIHKALQVIKGGDTGRWWSGSRRSAPTCIICYLQPWQHWLSDGVRVTSLTLHLGRWEMD